MHAKGGGLWVFVTRPWPQHLQIELAGVREVAVELDRNEELRQVVTDLETDFDELIARVAEEVRIERFEAAVAAYRARTGDRFLTGEEHAAVLAAIGYQP
jgi:hypothetical protein